MKTYNYVIIEGKIIIFTLAGLIIASAQPRKVHQLRLRLCCVHVYVCVRMRESVCVGILCVWGATFVFTRCARYVCVSGFERE